MGKRERRRREREKKKQAVLAAPMTVEFPPDDPRIRVIIKADQPQRVREAAAQYWEITEDGTWARTVASIGDQQWVAATAASVSHALLLNSLCVNCDEPIRVSNRSWAARVGGKYLDRPNEKYLCPECSQAQKQDQERERKLRAEAAEAEKAQEQKKAEERTRKITKLLAEEAAQDGSKSRLPDDSSSGRSLYLALANHAAYRSGEALPSVADLGPLAWTGDIDRDGAALLDLYHGYLLASPPETSREAFVVSEDGDVQFFSLQVKWRLVGDPNQIMTTAQNIKNHLVIGHGRQAHDARQSLAELVEHMEIINIISYLDGLLEKKYQYPEVPEGRRQELADILKKGFAVGYTSGQMICFAWRAADSAAGWKERNAHMGPPEAASAAVTSLKKKIDNAIELHHAIPEYDPPRWHQQPLALATLRELNSEIKRVHDRSVIDACPQCDHHGLRETDSGSVIRCTHDAQAPRQNESQAEPSDV